MMRALALLACLLATLPASAQEVRAPVPSGLVLVGKLIAADFNSTNDQPISISSPTTNYRYQLAIVAHPSCNMSSATVPVGGIYTGAGKTGTQIVAASFNGYSALTNNTVATNGSLLSVTLAQAAFYNNATVYFSLSTAHGSACTGDWYLYANPLD